MGGLRELGVLAGLEEGRLKPGDGCGELWCEPPSGLPDAGVALAPVGQRRQRGQTNQSELRDESEREVQGYTKHTGRGGSQ